MEISMRQRSCKGSSANFVHSSGLQNSVLPPSLIYGVQMYNRLNHPRSCFHNSAITSNQGSNDGDDGDSFCCPGSRQENVLSVSCEDRSMQEAVARSMILQGSESKILIFNHPMACFHTSATTCGQGSNDTDESDESDSSSSQRLTHVSKSGQANIVDVSGKDVTVREAVATGMISLGSEAFHLVKENKMAKGSVLHVAKLAGIMAAKQTSALIPLCHNIPIQKVDVDLILDHESHGVIIRSRVQCVGRTGVEMEALTAVSVAALTIYDMCNAVTHDMEIGQVKLEMKTGGQRSDFFRD